MIYEGTIAWTINDDSGHPHWEEIPNSLYFPKGHEWLISTQHQAQNATSANSDTTIMYGTRCVTHHYISKLTWGGGRFFCTVPLYKQTIFTLHTAPGYTAFTAYCAAVGYDPYLHDDQTDCIPDNLADFSHLSVTHSAMPLPMYPYPPPEG